MQWLGETPPASVSEPFRLVVERSLEQGAPAPVGFLYLDRDERWRDAVARLSLGERKGCVAAALDDEDLVAAARWSIGGGVLLPPSLSRVSAACRAAREAPAAPQWTGDPEAVAELSRGKDHLSVGLQPRGLWDVMVGLRGRLEVLTALATAVERPAVIGPGPTLTLGGMDRAAVETAWESLDSRPQWAAERRLLVFGDADLEPGSGVASSFEDRWWPVVHWPSGRDVAGWTLDPLNEACPWRLGTQEGKVLVAEPVSTRDDLERATTGIIRVQGVPSSDLDREGSPGAVVVEVLAREADREGLTLWIPGVSRNAGVVIRGWDLGVWVDGPVVAR